MPPTFTHEELSEILVDRVGLDPALLSAESDATFTDIGLDSLGFIELQLEIEERYGFEVTGRDAASITSLSTAVHYVNERLQRGNGS
jgi:minimal PKS acyl carrier protein